MKTFILKPDQIDSYYNFVISKSESIEESMLKTGIFGLAEIEVEEAKKIADIGDCLLFEYINKLVPFQIIEKTTLPDGTIDCYLQTYYNLEKRAFDQNTNVWRDAELRKYLNGPEFAAKFNPEFVAAWKTEDVHTDNYVTQDKCWIPSHEEIGYVDKNKMFKENIGAKCYKYYEEDAEEDTKTK